LKQLQSSEPPHAKLNPIRQNAALFWFGLRNDEIFYLRAAIQRTIDASPAFMEFGLAKKIAA
jgi:hypothetical protein